MAAHGRPARCVLSCPALPLPQAPFLPCARPLPLLPAAPAPVWSWRSLAPPSCPSRQIDKRQAPAPCGMPAALPCPSVPPAPSLSSCLPGPSALRLPPAALPLSPRCGRCASLCPSLQTERQTAGACAPQDARRLVLLICLSRTVFAPPAPPLCFPLSRQKDKRQARPPRCEPCRLLLPPLHLSRSSLPLPFRWARYTSRTERQTAGACVPQDACRFLTLLRAPFAALSLSPRFGHCALAWSLQTDRRTAGARAPRGALPTAPAPWGREEGDALPLPPGRCALASSRWDVGSCGHIRGQ